MKYLVIGPDKNGALAFARDLSLKLGLPLCEDTVVSSRSASNLADNTIYFAADAKYSGARAWFFDAIIVYRPSSVYCQALKAATPVKLYKLVSLDGEIATYSGQPCNALTLSAAHNIRQKILDKTNELTDIALDTDSMRVVNQNKQ